MFAGHLHPSPPAASTACNCGGPAADGLPADDWQLLFTAVCDRLQTSAGAATPADPLAPVVMDAVQALRSLQRLLGPPPPPEPALHAVPGCGQP